ncbi:MAG TPA: NrfD/PsrC family molybdoenzyme membrane anchor subunit [Candidatus Limnocylindrales bacterium]|jgi:molybdopterin-containing oxidoreductase family membrane subunit|nr:NrfD/PsrC family molybdoenzyme membrane anchor subunit [Candidatus Limnocylindrales bacterium]
MQQGPAEKTALMDVPWPDEPPVLGPGQTFGSMTDTIADAVLTRPIGLGWLAGLAIGMGLVAILMAAVTYLFLIGVGIWGINIPVGWGFAIINFVWWIGIGHAGTLISAILLLLKQSWRNSINRFAEAMTLFAVACAGMFPLLHMGRPWLAYWMFPYPSSMGVWPQFRSPLVWDVFAVSTYATISAVFWYVGLVPDFATMREKASHPLTRKVYGILGLGWRGSARHWKRYEALYILLAGIATPLVLSVHTVVSFDFAVAIVPGWHTTIFPPYFVAGAIYSGFAMVLVLAIPIRHFYRLESMITMRHLQNAAKIMLATGLIVGYGYFFEAFMAFYSGSTYERFMMQNRWFGPYAVFYWALILLNLVIPQVLWMPKVRANTRWLFLISLVVLVGMWLERFIIIVTSLSRDYLPSSWGHYVATRWDYAIFFGTLGFFATAIFIFIRIMPSISIFEMRTLLPESEVKAK